MSYSLSPNWRGRDQDRPGEPLFTLAEVADRLGIAGGARAISGLLSHHPGLKPWRGRHSFVPGSNHNAYYRMSDARRWFAAIPKPPQQK